MQEAIDGRFECTKRQNSWNYVATKFGIAREFRDESENCCDRIRELCAKKSIFVSVRQNCDVAERQVGHRVGRGGGSAESEMACDKIEGRRQQGKRQNPRATRPGLNRQSGQNMRWKNLQNRMNRLGVLAYYVEASMAVGFPNEIQTRAIDTSNGFIRILNPGASGSDSKGRTIRGFLFPRRGVGLLGRHVKADQALELVLRKRADSASAVSDIDL